MWCKFELSTTKNFQWIVKVFKFSEACDTNSYQCFHFWNLFMIFVSYFTLPLNCFIFLCLCILTIVYSAYFEFFFSLLPVLYKETWMCFRGGVNWDRSLLLVLEENIGIWFIHTLYLIQLRHMYIFQSTIYFKNTFYFEVWLQFNKSSTCASPRFHHAKHKKTQTK